MRFTYCCRPSRPCSASIIWRLGRCGRSMRARWRGCRCLPPAWRAAAGTAIAGAGYLVLGTAGGLVTLALALVLGGIGSSTQHPIASGLIASAYEGRRSRDALGTYNFAGDLGKVALPAIAAFLIAAISWRSTTWIIGTAA